MKQPHEMTPEELAGLRYGQWTGRPNGMPHQPDRCSDEVWPRGQWTSSQCSRANGHGPGGLYCKQHAKRYEATP